MSIVVLDTRASIDPILQDWIVGLQTPPSPKLKSDLNTLIKGLRTDGILNKTDLFLLCGGMETEAQALKPFITKGTSPCTKVGTVNWSTGGFIGAGTAADYINTNYNVSTQGVNCLLNSTGVALYVRDNQFDSNAVDCYSVGLQFWPRRNAGGTAIININTGADLVLGNAMPTATGLIHGYRNDAITTLLYRNGSLVVSGASASVAVPTTNLLLSFDSTRENALIWAGGGDVSQTGLYNNINRFMTARGINV